MAEARLPVIALNLQHEHQGSAGDKKFSITHPNPALFVTSAHPTLLIWLHSLPSSSFSQISQCYGF